MDNDLKLDGTDIQQTDIDAAAEKTLTQPEVDEIVKERLARERKKYADYDDVRADKETLSEISSILAKAGVSGTPTEQAKYLKNFYGVETKAVDRSPKDEEDVKALAEAERFAQGATNDEITDEVERILNITARKRKPADFAKLEVLGKKYGTIKFRKEYDEAVKWFNENHDTDIGDVLQNDEFKEFTEGSNLPIKAMLQKFMKFTGGAKQPKSPGSAKDIGGSAIKEYYTPNEVDRLTESQLSDPKIWQKVRESMTKWK
ncbi:MAG: hypothetical protein M0R40_10910 [Firmicutes bacterium]|nr:hypothetical protein [Bacillota bacterium]